MARAYLSKKAEQEINQIKNIFRQQNGYTPSVKEVIDLLIYNDNIQKIKNSEIRRLPKKKNEYSFTYKFK
jgi:hypothetical protein